MAAGAAASALCGTQSGLRLFRRLWSLPAGRDRPVTAGAGGLPASAALCGCLSFFLSAASLLASGGIIPPVLLPETVRRLGELSPIAWLRTMASYGLGHDCPPGVIGAWAVSAALLTAIACRLYCRRMKAAVEP